MSHIVFAENIQSPPPLSLYQKGDLSETSVEVEHQWLAEWGVPEVVH
jgi:hypothetical protein